MAVLAAVFVDSGGSSLEAVKAVYDVSAVCERSAEQGAGPAPAAVTQQHPPTGGGCNSQPVTAAPHREGPDVDIMD